ncbi:hypothetical protein GIB67_001817 [Kingdonia uniflora]|uniref:K-box domain-containing protein n=1 Tax=Kingdonia uniflora TaxID=39325 RepID=A0A7J7LBN2_9MAGN|nr:hypothetical protein GIB67_001817 [Kingdonia uniflora]
MITILWYIYSANGMQKTLERYERSSPSSMEAHNPIRDPQERSYHEYLRLKARVELLQRTERNLLGEDLGPLNVKELEQLEKQLDMSLRQVRSTKTQRMLDQLSDLQRQEQMMQQTNRALRSKLEESPEKSLRMSWEAGGQNVLYNRQSSQTERFFQPLECNSNLRIGYNTEYMNAAPQTQNVNGFIPGWML